MKRPIRVVLFDLGNTLLYDDPASWPHIYTRAEHALWTSLADAGVHVTPATLYGPYDGLLRYYYGLHRNDLAEPGTARVLNELLVRQGFHIPPARLRAALGAMYAITQTNWHAETDAASTLQALHENGLQLGVISNVADDLNAHQLLERTRLGSYFGLILTSVAFGRRKPDPGIFRAALDYFHVTPEEAVMVGDTYEADILGAAQIGMNTIWITRRVHAAPSNQPLRPDAAVTALSEIPELVA